MHVVIQSRSVRGRVKMKQIYFCAYSEPTTLLVLRPFVVLIHGEEF